MNFTVLIADDEAMPRNVLQNYIPWEELSVTRVYLASDGVEALEQARRYRPELIISDIKMPHLNGLEMAAAVREFLPDCQFIFLSGYSDKEYLKGAIRLKAANYVEKPLNLEEITAAVREITTQLLSQEKPTAEELFFLGGHFPDRPLNQEVFQEGEPILAQLENLIRHSKKEEVLFHLDRVYKTMGRCQGTAPEELRHLYCRILFLFLHAVKDMEASASTRVRHNNEIYFFIPFILHTPSSLDLLATRLICADSKGIIEPIVPKFLTNPFYLRK